MNRDFYTTDSPSMDILLSSNFERFLFYAAGEDAKKVDQWEKDLLETGTMRVTPEELQALRKDFEGGWIGDEETEASSTTSITTSATSSTPIRPLPTASA